MSSKTIQKNKTYTYTFKQSGDVKCIMKGGSAEIHINNNTANTYTFTGQAASDTFGAVTKNDSTTQWKLVIKGAGVTENSTVDIDAPSLGKWS